MSEYLLCTCSGGQHLGKSSGRTAESTSGDSYTIERRGFLIEELRMKDVVGEDPAQCGEGFWWLLLNSGLWSDDAWTPDWIQWYLGPGHHAPIFFIFSWTENVLSQHRAYAYWFVVKIPRVEWLKHGLWNQSIGAQILTLHLTVLWSWPFINIQTLVAIPSLELLQKLN